MNEAIARRVFLAVVVTCLFAFGLAGSIAILSREDLGAISLTNRNGVSATAQQPSAKSSQLDPNTSAQQQVAAVAGDIATSSTELSRVTADMEAVNK